ncbi:peptidoglycan bridge formation glycyltransferase FemA/FemB family protein [Candidatus Parcubacteria bacterium]|nr:peptidoglycan bridge formation glycyltransferase FemA/FemB family protein [Patescibacteria group bacterium]MBU4308894.1 peptidoglycan bridge formation glycyltransferase FemA/FemB family protein [Patescibacteria group bacterium]MBU4432604.1 peptidoglycan bridge formation glycyltransferase FemA/FemB family protein [Patescibacteria group bacterium]MBU4577254.1 peptidoglycan bridge formation glycyltransferase FemA/FemB family protein [Patescibacteria group bacterium]MCG2696945.1 peptidoglycan br
MKLIELNKEKLNNFLAEQRYSQFLQSHEWSEFQERVGQRVFRFGVEKDGKIMAVVSLIKKNIGAGKAYFYCPRGPVFWFSRIQYSVTAGFKLEEGPKVEIWNFLFTEIKKIAQTENCLFLRFDPTDDFYLKGTSFKVRQTIDVQPSKTLILNLENTEENLLKEMHQKTRYNIRLAEKKGVTIREAGIDEFDKFWALMSETVERDGFRLHGKDYYKKMLSTPQPSRSVVGVRVMSDELKIKLYFAEYEGRIIAANIITFFGDMVTYVHGSSSDQDRNVMAPYLLQWEIIKQAKNLGYKHYDFYGIDEIKWPGVTRFKKGFGGQEQTYPGTFDVIFNNFSYKAYQALRWLRRKF